MKATKRLREPWIDCIDCPLYRTRRKIVIGKGSMPADLLFLGEAPGNTEDVIGKPFVGRSGNLLDDMLNDAIKLLLHDYRDKVIEYITKSKATPLSLEDLALSYYITNCLLCRPCDGRREKNRTPTKEELVLCSDKILSIIRKVDPKVIIFVGKVAESNYRKEFKFKTTFNILHPGFILRRGGKASPWYGSTVRLLSEAINEVLKLKHNEEIANAGY